LRFDLFDYLGVADGLALTDRGEILFTLFDTLIVVFWMPFASSAAFYERGCRRRTRCIEPE
jgi:hypothetical protein